MKNVLTIEAFAEWLETKPSSEKYNWSDSENCACGQYAKATGEKETAGGFWLAAQGAAFELPHTFGALAARLRSGAYSL